MNNIARREKICYSQKIFMEQAIQFQDLGLDGESLSAIEKKGFEKPSPIQLLAIPKLLSGNANVIARARTGTGKTAAFGLPIIQKLRSDKKKSDVPRALILEPTRELAMQTCKELQSFVDGKFPRICVVYGGAPMGSQLRDLKRGAEIVVGTPGRVMDLINRGALDISEIDYFILDEGDEMLDMGFIEDIESIFESANEASRILLFSATMPKPILNIASQFMGDYEIIEEEEVIDEALQIKQTFWLLYEADKIEALVRLIDFADDFYGLVFTQTKMDADTVSKQLDERGYEVAVLHGDIMQSQREKVLERFRKKKTRILVATDVAARGIDITGLTHVVNYSLPQDTWTYIHRIGRTGRAGAAGVAISFVRPEEKKRKLPFLQTAVKKKTKTALVQEEIPSIKNVLEKKRERLFSQLKNDVLKNENIDEHIKKMANELCDGNDAEEMLSRVLSLWFGKSVRSDYYGEIKTVRERGQKDSKKNDFKTGNAKSLHLDSKDALRLYVQLGRRDGLGAREVAKFFSDLLDIPNRYVDKISVSQNFSLVTLPKVAAEKALKLSEKEDDVPHMHIDTKAKVQSKRKRSGSRKD